MSRLIILGIALLGAFAFPGVASASILVEDAFISTGSGSLGSGTSEEPRDPRYLELAENETSDATMDAASLASGTPGASGQAAVAYHARITESELVGRLASEIKLLFANPPPLGLLKPPRRVSS